MSAGYITRRIALPFNGCPTGRLYRPEEGYSSGGRHSGNFGQNRNTAIRA
jgi:hypothetical protein